MSEKTHCDRCDRIIDERIGSNDGGFVDLPGDGLDLCSECITAFRAWVVGEHQTTKET